LHNAPELIYNLKRLAVLRLITCAGITISLLILGFDINNQLQQQAAWGILSLMTILSLLNLARARKDKALPYEVFIYLLIDSVLIVALMYFTGGANNPFITYLLVPIVISAATLSWLLTWILCVLAMLAYGGLLFFYQPLASLNLQMAQLGLSLHIVGMWLTFVLSALFIAYFVVEMAQESRHQANLAAHFREQSIQNEHLMLLASQAASTAHELGTPLTTLKVLTHELQQLTQDEDTLSDLGLMNQQIDLCKHKLNQLSQQNALEQGPELALHDFIEQTLQQWLLMRPHAQFHWQSSNKTQSPLVQYPQVLQQAMINLLDNAMSVSSEPLILNLKWDQNSWLFSIKDNGPGLEKEFELPNSPMSSEKGMGIGLLLSHSSVQRLGGKVTLSNGLTQGCLTEVAMPLNKTEMI
jgi:two-component system sensor histidine kinase RegB